MFAKLGIALVVLMVALPAHANAAMILSPGDLILGGQSDGTNFSVGVAGFGANSWPGGESPDHAIDGVGQKYLNFGKTNTGFIVTPSVGSSVVVDMTLWTANDAIPRDPASFELWGTNVAIVGGGPFALSSFTQIAAGPLSLPDSRNGGGVSPLLPENSQTVSFANSAAFTSYMVIFPTVKDEAGANSMQIAEVQLGTGNVVPEPSSMLSWLGLICVGIARCRRIREFAAFRKSA